MQSTTSDENVGDGPNSPTTPARFDRANFIKGKIKSGIKDVFDKDRRASSDDIDTTDVLFEDAAFNPQHILDPTPREHSSLKDKVHRSAGAIAATLKNPRRAMRSKYTRTVAGNLSTHPDGFEERFDNELIDAYDELERADIEVERSIEDEDASRFLHTSARDVLVDGSIHCSGGSADVNISDADTRQEDVNEAREKIRKVEAKRDSMKAAWILGRHVRRVRVARPMQHAPIKSDFIEQSTYDGVRRVQWPRYLARLALWHSRHLTASYIDDFEELPFDMKDTSLATERLAVVSGPWQSFLMEVRRVYLWDDPRRTTIIMAIYIFLWHLQHIMTAAFAAVVILTLRNRYTPTRIETIRARVLRAKDDQARAQAWGELIQRYGKHDWIEPLLDQMGPLAQLEITDIASLLEVLQSFYRWERPKKTVVTLGFFSVCFLVSLMGSMAFCVRLLWGGLGFFFFVTLPLSSRYPKYRKIFNPIYWMFWDIPDSAQLAIMQLQKKAMLRDTARMEQTVPNTTLSQRDSLKVPTADESAVHEHSLATEDYLDTLKSIQDQDQVSFDAVDSKNSLRGRLQLMRRGLWYRDQKQELYYPYPRLMEVRKVDISLANDPDSSRMARVARHIQKSTSLQFLPSGIEFFFLPRASVASEEKESPAQDINSAIDEQLALTVSEIDRDKIFSLVISWSNLKWQPLFSLNTRHDMMTNSGNSSKHAQGNENLDHVMKSFAHHDN